MNDQKSTKGCRRTKIKQMYQSSKIIKRDKITNKKGKIFKDELSKKIRQEGIISADRQ